MAGAAAGAAGADDDPFAGLPDPADPFAGLLGPASSSCEGLLCVEATDCTDLYPDEAARCNFTSCVDFVCQ
jgi:hypothetical protein